LTSRSYCTADVLPRTEEEWESNIASAEEKILPDWKEHKATMHGDWEKKEAARAEAAAAAEEERQARLPDEPGPSNRRTPKPSKRAQEAMEDEMEESD
jgi:hypothetical protein